VRQNLLLLRSAPALLRSLLAVTVLAGSFVVAHGYGQRYDLPVPLWLYLLGSGAAVLLSFVAVGLFIRGALTGFSYPTFNLFRTPVGRVMAHPVVVKTLRVLSIAVFTLIIVAGLFGTQSPVRNIAPALVWVIWWVGVAYVSALVGNVWALINPWKILFEWLEALTRREDPEAELSLHLDYPTWLGVWPGVVLFFAFAWIEIVSSNSALPVNLAALALIYSGITLGGMFLYGKDVWLRHGEAFSLVFGLLARFAPTEVRVRDAGVCEACDEECLVPEDGCVNCYACFEHAPREKRELNIRPFAVGLLRNENISFSMMTLVILLLATVTFDGFASTPLWEEIQYRLYEVVPNPAIIGTVGLLVFPLLFMALYLVICALMAAAARVPVPTLELARKFVLTLVPIALAYHLAHYLTYLLVQAQTLIPLASDPFGFGWNLFGTAGYEVNISVLGARFAWFTAVIAIVVGHIIAVYLAHMVALRVFERHQPALRSQYPMLLLMVIYTVISLWILAQPIVEFTPPA
jgi:polyferredoxin